MEIKIEKGIPIPARPGRSMEVFSQALLKLDVGDSFFAENFRPAAAAARWRRISQTTGRKFTSRTTDGGCRVWRIA